MKVWKQWLFVAVLIIGTVLLPTERTAAQIMTTQPTDIGENYRMYDEVMFLSTGGFLSSDDPARYVAEGQMTRKHAAMMIGAALGLDGTPRWSKFKDITSGSVESGYIQSAANAGIISGYKDGTFKPNQMLNRGEMAVLLSRVDGNAIPNATRAGSYLMAQGIANGIRPGDFGVKEGMKRGDFAAFLTRTINPTYRTKGVQLQGVPHYVKDNVGSGLNMRKGPKTTYAQIAKIPANTPVTVYKVLGHWAFIQANGQYGYVHMQYLSVGDVSESDERPAIVTPPKPPVAPSQPVETTPAPANTSDVAYVRNQLIAIDPGHGGSDPGAIGHGYTEKQATLAISKYANNYFNEASMRTMMTRTDDRFVGLSERARMANAARANMFISVHINSAGNDSATGLETYHYGTSNAASVKPAKALASYMKNRMVEAWPLRDRGVKTANFAVIRETAMPATLIEAGFINNKGDNYYIRTPKEQQKMGRAIYLATLDYYYHYEGKKGITSLYQQVGGTPSKRLH